MSNVVRGIQVRPLTVSLDLGSGSSTESCRRHKPLGDGTPNKLPALVFGAIGLAGVLALWLMFGPMQGLLGVVGLLMGAALYRADFGLSSAWSRILHSRDGSQMCAQAVMLATAATAVTGIAALNVTVFGHKNIPVAGVIGLALPLGAFLFGIGMQIGASCATGTLFAVGTGHSAIGFTLFGFISGAVLYTWAFPVFRSWPATEGLLLSDHLGMAGSWATTILVLGLIAFAAVRRSQFRVARRAWKAMLWSSTLIGLLAGAVFLIAGRVWTVTNAFALWGAKFLQMLGVPVEDWEFWQQASNAAVLQNSVWLTPATVTSVGIMIGAALAAALGGGWKLHTTIEPWPALLAVCGGLLMGFGARLSGGCNIGAFIGGVSQGSVSGWIWGASALVGGVAGARLRRTLGLSRRRPLGGIC